MKIAGIDYSMTCPAITIFDGDVQSFEYSDCNFYYYSDKKKYNVTVDNINGTFQKPWETQMERFNNISDWAFDLVYECDVVSIEDYSMNSKGKVFHIAENTGILKYKLWADEVYVMTFPPANVKKFATGKGNAKKEVMQEHFINETGVDLKSKLNQTQKQWSPSGDIIDSYFIAKMAWDMYKED